MPTTCVFIAIEDLAIAEAKGKPFQELVRRSHYGFGYDTYIYGEAVDQTADQLMMPTNDWGYETIGVKIKHGGALSDVKKISNADLKYAIQNMEMFLVQLPEPVATRQDIENEYIDLANEYSEFSFEIDELPPELEFRLRDLYPQMTASVLIGLCKLFGKAKAENLSIVYAIVGDDNDGEPPLPQLHGRQN